MTENNRALSPLPEVSSFFPPESLYCKPSRPHSDAYVVVFFDIRLLYRPTVSTLTSGKALTNTYDSLGRLTQKRWSLSSNYDTSISYISNADGTQTALVASWQNGSDTPYTYQYDANGNITRISQGSASVTYAYDSANQLIRENNGFTNQTVTYEYDSWGNILNKKTYAYTTGDLTTPTSTDVYTYGNESWGDQLTAYNGQTIAYDEMGNPTTYLGYTMGWQGKQLISVNNGTNNITYTYNEDGLRLTKTVNGTTTNYYYNGSVLISMTTGSTTQQFHYDASGNAIAVTYNGTEYYYVRNAQGDIVKLIDASGNAVVEYTYDSWGKLLSTTSSLATTLGDDQPFRYRGYTYDTETSLYYLQTRYYDPTTCRFISSDFALSTGQGVLGHNAYAYCLNNPTNQSDSEGTFSLPNWAKVVIGVVTTVAAVAITVATGAAAPPVLIGVAVSTLGGAASDAIEHRITIGSWEGAGEAALDGAADGFMMGGLCAFGGSMISGAVRTIKNAKAGITIGKVGTFEDVAKLAKTRHYSGLKEFKMIEKVAGTKTAEAVGWWQNKCVVKGVMLLKGAIYDCGGALTGAYAKEVALTKGYEFLYNIWLM